MTETLSLKLKYHSLFLYFLCFLTPQNIRKIVSLQIKTNPCRIKTTNTGVLPLTTCQNLNQRIILKCPQSTASFISAFITLSSIYAHFHIFRSRSSHSTLTQVTRLVLMLRTGPGVALCFLTITHVCDSGLGSSDLSSPGVVTALHQPLS